MQKRRTLNGNTKDVVRKAESLLQIVSLSLIYYLVFKYGYMDAGFSPFLGRGKIMLMGVYALLCGMFITNMDGFQFGNLRRFDLVMAQWIALLVTNFITYFQLCLIANKMVSILPMLALMLIDTVMVVTFVYAYSASFHLLYKPYRMVLVYGTENAVTLKLKMDTRRDKYRIDRLICVEKGMEAICQEIVKYDAVIINDVPPQIRNDLVKFCYGNNIRTYVVPKITDIILRGGGNITTFDTPLLLTKGFGLTISQRILKRTVDIILCLIAVIAAAPVMAVIAIAIKLEDGGPVFYKQKRATMDGKEFDILKFRSMIMDAEKDGFSVPATGKDPRITRVGNVIRACRVDELPQILNILKGDMSIVGPRPERLEHVYKYSEAVPEFMYRLKVKGGLTGYAQIYGKYNTTPYDKLRLDLMYIENYSILLDIKLILMTVRILFSKESTEGFEKQQENQQRLQEMLRKLQAEENMTSAREA